MRTFLRGITAYHDADDMAQETFLALWTHARSYRGGNVRACRVAGTNASNPSAL